MGHKCKELSTKVHWLKLQEDLALEASKHWNQACASPIVPHLLQRESPTHYVTSRFNLYDGMKNPIEHFYHYQQFMMLVGNREGLFFRVFFYQFAAIYPHMALLIT